MVILGLGQLMKGKIKLFDKVIGEVVSGYCEFVLRGDIS